MHDRERTVIQSITTNQATGEGTDQLHGWQDTSRGHRPCFSLAARAESTFANPHLPKEQEWEHLHCLFHLILNRFKTQICILVSQLNKRPLAQYLLEEVFTVLHLEHFPPPLMFHISCLQLSLPSVQIHWLALQQGPVSIWFLMEDLSSSLRPLEGPHTLLCFKLKWTEAVSKP